MKARIIPVILLAVLAMYLQGCYSTSYYRMVNREQLLNKHGYQSGNMNFKMRSSDLNAPMFSKKGQVNLELNAGGGWGGNLSIAATDKLGIYFKGSSRTAEDIFNAYDTMIYESSDNGENWTGPYQKTVGIETTHDLRNGFFETGFGTYKMNMAKNLRYDLFGGMSIGSARNSYNLNIESYYFGFNEYRSYWACFTQADISFVAAHFEATLLNRLSYFNFYHQEFSLDYPINTYTMWPTSIALEEGIRVGFGGRGWRFFGQYDFVVPMIEGDTEWYGSNFKVGITARIGDQLRMDVKKKDK